MFTYLRLAARTLLGEESSVRPIFNHEFLSCSSKYERRLFSSLCERGFKDEVQQPGLHSIAHIVEGQMRFSTVARPELL